MPFLKKLLVIGLECLWMVDLEVSFAVHLELLFHALVCLV